VTRSLSSLAILLFAACSSPAEEASGTEPQIYRSARDGLCIAGDRAGLITFGPANANCSVSGSFVREGERLVITPSGDQNCRVPVEIPEGRAVVGARSPACGYYCGPDADYSGRTLTRASGTPAVTDLAGDPLC
jgi:hypothetical protein